MRVNNPQNSWQARIRADKKKDVKTEQALTTVKT